MRFHWEKKGLIFDRAKYAFPNWASNSTLQPTPILIDNGEKIRFYVGMRDDEGQSRIGFIDVLSKNPKEILAISKYPVLDLGIDGCFDDAGVVPSAVYKAENEFFLYYAGYSLLKKVRFSVFGGLATSETGENFARYSSTPVFERTRDHTLFRVPHTILKEKDVYKIWYGAGSHFFEMDNYTYPVYDIYFCETDDLAKIPNTAIKALTFSNEDEYRVARPYVVARNNVYQMFLCVSTKSKGYRLGLAESTDGYNWIRCDEKLNINVSEEGWDSEMMGYPSFLETKYGSYLFYNGNKYGQDGFGYAELIAES